MVKGRLNINDFDFELPEELIAQYPSQQRTDSRLLLLNKNKSDVTHSFFRELPDYLLKGDVLVLNDTKVIPTRLVGHKEDTDTEIEVFVLERIDATAFRGLVKPLKRVRGGQKIVFGDGSLKAVVNNESDAADDAKRTVRFESDSDVLEKIKAFGRVPLPPYIRREPSCDDRERYQTVYAKSEGAVAAPTAGLHFSEDLLEQIRKKGVKVVYVTLHVGYGTFKPVTEKELASGKLEFEAYEISAETADTINEAKRESRRVVVVGTTSVRTLESAAFLDSESGSFLVKAQSTKTDLFIWPGYDFKITDALITNFHLPKSSLFMLVSAFAGRDTVKSAYECAVAQKYRFYSYGDSMFIS